MSISLIIDALFLLHYIPKLNLLHNWPFE